MEPVWLDPTTYPFTSRYLDLAMGRMHYVDEGQGEPIVFVHGTPTWSFLYRDLIKRLSARYRCVAPDQIGFGLSDKPVNWTYRPANHTCNLATLVEHLDLRTITLIVHDFGGPIGLGYAVDHPDNVAQLVVFNTWMWSLADDPQARRVDRLVRGALGKFLYTRLNASPRFLLPALWANKATLTPEVRKAYTAVHPRAQDRMGMYHLARELLGSSEWYSGLWERRARLANIPALLLWGLKDTTFGPALGRWREVFPQAQIITCPDAGHFVMEEEPSAGEHVERFIAERAVVYGV
jgi:pimeloyl-ACP methyl ester carboxylesterase